MAIIQTRSGKPIGLLLTAVTGNVLPLKLIPAPGEASPDAFTIAQSTIARATDVENRARAPLNWNAMMSKSRASL